MAILFKYKEIRRGIILFKIVQENLSHFTLPFQRNAQIPMLYFL